VSRLRVLGTITFPETATGDAKFPVPPVFSRGSGIERPALEVMEAVATDPNENR